MKKIICILLLLGSSPIWAQHILRSDIVYQGKVQISHYMFFTTDADELKRDLGVYLGKMGKMSEEKNIMTISNIKSGNIGNSLDKMVAILEENKDFSTVNILLLDENENSLDDREINKDRFDEFMFDFYDLVYKNEEKRLAQDDLEITEKELDKAQKSVNRAEKSIEANLNAQEKLGKKLEQSPEELSKIIKEKDEIYQKILAQSEEVKEKPEELEKEMSKKDKAIIKAKDDKEKNAEKLVKKEEEFSKLTDELILARKYLEQMQQVVNSKKAVIQELK